MAQVVNTNIMSLTAQRNLNGTQSAMQTALQRLSSGMRINSAKDDAAGLAISERFTAQIRGLNQASRNASDAISLSQTAEGSLQEITTNVQRIRELAVQSANASNSTSDRSALNIEVTQLKSEIVRIIGSKFNGKAIIGASATTFNFQVGADKGDTIGITTTNLSTNTTRTAISNLGVSSVASAASMITKADAFLSTLNNERAKLGAIQSRFDSVIRNVQNMSENLTAARSRIKDADFAAETSALTRAQILSQAGTAMLSQANSVPQNVLSLLR